MLRLALPRQFDINIKTIDKFISLSVLSLPSVLPAHTRRRDNSEFASKSLVFVFQGNNFPPCYRILDGSKINFNILRRNRRARSDWGCLLLALQTDRRTNEPTHSNPGVNALQN